MYCRTVPSLHKAWSAVSTLPAPIAGTDRPWLYTHAVGGPLRLTIRLGPDGTSAGPHRVILHFCELHGAPADGRFSVTAQGRTVLSNITVREQAGGPNRALIKELTADAASLLTLEALPAGEPASPSICGIEVIKQ